MNTNDLIASLSTQAPRPRLQSPRVLAKKIILLLVAYGTIVQFFLGVRPDLALQFTHPLFVVEVVLLLALSAGSIAGAIAAMYPDALQKPWLLQLPYALFGALAVFILLQLVMYQDMRMVRASADAHSLECTLCIASVALIPSALIFGLLRKGASVHSFRAGSFAVLAAVGMGCLTLRLAEANDSLLHLSGWHYLPTLLFAALGAGLGKVLLRW